MVHPGNWGWCPTWGTTTCRAFGSVCATSRASSMPSMGSYWPEIISTGTADRTGAQ